MFEELCYSSCHIARFIARLASIGIVIAAVGTGCAQTIAIREQADDGRRALALQFRDLPEEPFLKASTPARAHTSPLFLLPLDFPAEAAPHLVTEAVLIYEAEVSVLPKRVTELAAFGKRALEGSRSAIVSRVG